MLNFLSYVMQKYYNVFDKTLVENINFYFFTLTTASVYKFISRIIW